MNLKRRDLDTAKKVVASADISRAGKKTYIKELNKLGG
jgi:hypothetical protein